MGRTPRCSKDGLNRGSWTALEDKLLVDYVALHGDGKWSNVAKKTSLKRCGKSCRLRWLNYLRPDIKRGNISDDEEQLIIRLHKLLGNRWSLIAGRLPGRTDNEIKNYWNTNLAKKAQELQLTLPKLIHKKQAPPPTKELPATTDTGTVAVADAVATPVLTQQPRKDQIINLEKDNYAQMGSILLENKTESNNDHFLMDFSVEDFCKILDSDFTRATDDHQHANDNDNVTQGDDHDVNGNGDKTQFPVNWEADNNDQMGSDFTSLLSFLDSDVEW